MSTATNSIESGHWPIDGFDIPVDCVPFSDPIMQAEDWHEYRPICAAELYGILWSVRQGNVEVMVTCSDPVYVCVMYNPCCNDVDYFRLSWAEMSEFLSYYCGIIGLKPNWKEEGF